MPAKKPENSSDDDDGSKAISILTSKDFTTPDIEAMEIDGPAVITEVLPSSDLVNTSDHLVGIDRVEDELPAEIMDTTTPHSRSPSPDTIISHDMTDMVQDIIPTNSVAEKDVLLSTVSATKRTLSTAPQTGIVNTTTPKIIAKTVTATAKTITVSKGQNSNSSSNQQIRLIPISQAGSSGIPIQIVQGGQSTNATQIVLTSLSGSPSKAVLKSIGPSSVLLSPSKQNTSSNSIASGSSTPSKQNVVVGKILLSPNKSPSKIAPVTISKASQVQNFLPTLSVAGSSVSNSAACSTSSIINSVTPTVISAAELQRLLPASQQGSQSVTSPTKIIQVKGPVGQAPVIARLARPGVKQVTIPSNTLQGNKVQFIRLVASSANAGKGSPTLVPISSIQTTTAANKTATIVTTSASAAAVAATIRPASTSTGSNQIRMTIPIAPAVSTRPSGGPRLAQKVIIPAPNVSGIAQIRQSGTLNRLPPGATLISSGNNSSSIVMLPAQYLNQLQNVSQITTPKSVIAPKPTISTASVAMDTTAASATDNASSQSKANATAKPTDVNGSRQRKPCNCTKSQCLKLYCDCFANGEFCNNCNCNRCFNNLDHEEERQKAIKSCLDRNPQAFHPKIGKGRAGEVERRHNKGCNCKRSGCFKNYCECYEAKILCTDMCKCVGCKNFEETADRKSLMHLADAAEVRVQQQNDASTKFPMQIKDLPSKPSTVSSSGQKLPFSFVTNDVSEVTCQCLLAQAEEAEKLNLSEAATEVLILEEFGRCLRRIIEYAHKTKLQV